MSDGEICQVDMRPEAFRSHVRSHVAMRYDLGSGVIQHCCTALYKGPRNGTENGVVLHGGLYGPPYELPVGQNVQRGFSGKVISIIHPESFS